MTGHWPARAQASLYISRPSQKLFITLPNNNKFLSCISPQIFRSVRCAPHPHNKQQSIFVRFGQNQTISNVVINERTMASYLQKLHTLHVYRTKPNHIGPHGDGATGFLIFVSFQRWHSQFNGNSMFRFQCSSVMFVTYPMTIRSRAIALSFH